MIKYDFGFWGIYFIFQLRGSIFHKAMMWALPNALIVIGLKQVFNRYPGPTELSSTFPSLWSGFTFSLGFLIIFRTQIAYSRFWEGVTLMHNVRAVWFNATSNLISFTSTAIEKKDEVQSFQHLLVRLMSMLFCTALQEVSDMSDEDFEILGDDGINARSLQFLYESGDDKTEILLAWIQRLVVVSHGNGVLPIAPPILSRVFQELSTGIVELNGAKKISETPFPFPYAQMISCLLLLHWIISPIVNCMLINDTMACAIVTFATVFALWSINYIAAEIEMPFGDDCNDLPISEFMVAFNDSLRILMHPMSQSPPEFEYNGEEFENTKFSNISKAFEKKGALLDLPDDAKAVASKASAWSGQSEPAAGNRKSAQNGAAIDQNGKACGGWKRRASVQSPSPHQSSPRESKTDRIATECLSDSSDESHARVPVIKKRQNDSIIATDTSMDALGFLDAMAPPPPSGVVTRLGSGDTDFLSGILSPESLRSPERIPRMPGESARGSDVPSGIQNQKRATTGNIVLASDSNIAAGLPGFRNGGLASTLGRPPDDVQVGLKAPSKEIPLAPPDEADLRTLALGSADVAYLGTENTETKVSKDLATGTSSPSGGGARPNAADRRQTMT